MSVTYSWKMNGIFKADATLCKGEIDTLESITPENVLRYAEANEDSELHKCFEWNDSVAAHKYRLGQARTVIQFIIERPVKKDDVPVRTFQISSEKNTYQPKEFFFKRPDEHQMLLKRAKRELTAIKERYDQVSEMENVIKSIDEFLGENVG